MQHACILSKCDLLRIAIQWILIVQTFYQPYISFRFKSYILSQDTDIRFPVYILSIVKVEHYCRQEIAKIIGLKT